MWLNAASRDEFHQTFRGILEALIPDNSNTTASFFYMESPIERIPSAPTIRYSEPPTKPKVPPSEPVHCNLKGKLIDH